MSAEAQRAATSLRTESACSVSRSLISPFPLYLQRSSVLVLGLDCCFLLTFPLSIKTGLSPFLQLRGVSLQTLCSISAFVHREDTP